jgi:hypothetical protein
LLDFFILLRLDIFSTFFDLHEMVFSDIFVFVLQYRERWGKEWKKLKHGRLIATPGPLKPRPVR